MPLTAEMLKEFKDDIAALPPAEQQQLIHDFYYQKLLPSPEWKQISPEAQQQFVAAFSIPTVSGQERPGFLKRVMGEYNDPRTMNPLAHAGNAMTAIGTPGRAIKEAMMTPYYEGLGKQRPVRDPSEKSPLEPGGLAGMIPKTLGEWVEMAVGPKAAQIALSPARITGILAKLRQLDSNIAANKAGAAGEAMGWHYPPQRALPANAGPGSPTPMPGRVYSPFELAEMRKAQQPQHAPRPPELIPRRRGGGDLYESEGEVWQR